MSKIKNLRNIISALQLIEGVVDCILNSVEKFFSFGLRAFGHDYSLSFAELENQMESSACAEWVYYHHLRECE
jgi:hypothetical protein